MNLFVCLSVCLSVCLCVQSFIRSQWQCQCFSSACQPMTVLLQYLSANNSACQLFWLLIGCLKALSLEHIRRVCKGECVGYIRQMDYMTQHSQWSDFRLLTWLDHDCSNMISPCLFKHVLVQTWFHHACSNMISPCFFRQNFITLVQTWFHHVCPDMISSYLFSHDFTILVQS